MPGVQGNKGNRTVRRGRKLRRTIHLSEDAAHSLRVITLHARGVRNREDLTEDDVVMELIEKAWRALDEEYSRD